MGAPIMGSAPIFALSFYGNDLGKRLVEKTGGKAGQQQLTAFQLGLAGGFSGLLTTVVMAPGERIKCILQVIINWADVQSHGWHSWFVCLRL